MHFDQHDASAEVARRLDATPELVFAAFADSALVRRWLKPAPEVGLEVLSYDFRVGGTYRFAYQVPNGGLMRVNGLFEMIEPPTRLVFTWIIEPPDEHAGIHSEVHVSITRAGAGSRLRIRHMKLERTGAPRRHAEGWRGAVDQLSALFANQGDADDAG